jgi:azurin
MCESAKTMKSPTVSSLCVIALLLAGCGKGEKSAPATSAAAPAAPAAVSAPAVASFEVTANDAMKFNLTRIEVKAGQDVKITLSNIGTLPKVAMGHNLVVLKKDVDVKAFTDAAVTAAATEYIPAGQADKIIAHTKLLGPKQSDTITFKAPTEPGEYHYICSFPAHCIAGMRGVLVVQ